MAARSWGTLEMQPLTPHCSPDRERVGPVPEFHMFIPWFNILDFVLYFFPNIPVIAVNKEFQQGKLIFAQHCLSGLGTISSIFSAVCLELVLSDSLHVNQLPIQIAFSLPSHLSPAAPCCQLVSSLQISHKPCWKLSWKCSVSDFAVCCISTDNSWFLPCRKQDPELFFEGRALMGIPQDGQVAQILLWIIANNGFCSYSVLAAVLSFFHTNQESIICHLEIKESPNGSLRHLSANEWFCISHTNVLFEVAGTFSLFYFLFFSHGAPCNCVSGQGDMVHISFALFMTDTHLIFSEQRREGLFSLWGCIWIKTLCFLR